MKLDVSVYPSRSAMGTAAGSDIEARIIQLLNEKEALRMIFAAAPSQNEVLNYLANSKQIEWNRITAFHMDEYIGLEPDAPQLFAAYLHEKLFGRVPLKKTHYIHTGGSVAEELLRYSALIEEAPIDMVCLGIGENGHIAFNDPPVADFNDEAVLKKVSLEPACRLQQVHEGCFPSLDQVPETALTLTIPVIMKAAYLYCVVPGSSKQEAVYNALTKEVSTSCPATILQMHPHCKYYFDHDAYRLAAG